MIVFNSLLKQGLLSIDESTLAFENGKLTAKISMGGYTEVETLPSIAEAKEGVTYLVPTGDYFTMYVVDKTNGKWITLGTTASKSYEFGDGLVETDGVVTLDEKPKAIRDYFVHVNQWGAVVPYLSISDSLVVQGDISTDSALIGETLKIGSTIGADSTGLYDTRTTYPDDGKYVVTKYLLEERIKDLTLSVPTNLSQLNNDVGFATQSWASSQITSSRNQCVLKSGSTMTGALTINNDLKALPLGYTTSMGVPAYGLQVSSTYGLQLFGTHFLNGTLWGDDGLKIVSNNLSLNTLDEAFISSDYANTTTFRAMPNDGTQATYKFEGWGWDDDSHTTKSPRLGVRLLKPNQATALESTSVLNMSEGDNRWVSLSGGTMTGYLNIPSPTSSSHPTTKSYVDNLVASSGGLKNNATGTGSLSILGKETTSNYTTSVGYKALASSVYSTAIGYDSTAIGVSSTAIGNNAYAYAGGSTAIGDNASAMDSRSTAIGGYSNASKSYSTALGSYASATDDYAAALGYYATSSETGVTAISAWNDSGSAKTQLKIIGKGSTASTNKLSGKSGIEYEEYDTSGNVSTSGVISFEDLVSGGGGGGGSGDGLQNLATGTDSLSILGTATTSEYSVTIGDSSNASGTSSLAVGLQAQAFGSYTTAWGVNAASSERGAMAFGLNSYAYADYSIALGVGASSHGKYSTAIGFDAKSPDAGSVSFATWDDNASLKTFVRFIGANSSASVDRLNGKSGIEYEEYDARGVVTQSGAISFEALVSGGGGGGGNYLPLSGGTVTDNFAVLPLGTTTSLGLPAYGLQVSSTYGLQLFGTHFLNGTLWGDDGLKIVNNNLSLTTLDEAFISSDYANTTTFRAMPNDGTQATYKFEGWGWDDDSHTSKSPRLGVRLLKPSQATPLEATSVLNMEEGDTRWVRGTNIKTINGESLVGSGDITISGGGGLENKATGVYSLSILGNSTTSGYSVTIGVNANANAGGSTALGYYAYTSGYYSIALGYCTVASGTSSTALGHSTTASGYYSTALGFKATSSEKGVTAISAWNDSGNAKTQFKIIGKGSTASTNKLGGKSGIEYEEYNTSGTITNSGAISFEDLVSGGGGSSGGGLENLATGDESLSILGVATTSNGSTSVGTNANASGRNAIAVGYAATASNADTTVVGFAATASGKNAIALGEYASATAMSSIAIGFRASASGIGSTVLGITASATAMGSTAIGSFANASDNGVTVLSAVNDDGTTKTQLYLIGAGSTMSTTYCDGEAGLGFMSKDGDGNILKRGTIKLSALCTENTDTFEPSGW